MKKMMKMMMKKTVCVCVLSAAAWASVRGEEVAGSMLDMALHHEKSLSEGLGMLMPGPGRYMIDRGLLPLPTVPSAYYFPDFFINGLVPVEHHGVTVYPVSAVVDDGTGNTYFYDANGQWFTYVYPFNNATYQYSSNWIARLWYGENFPEPVSPLLLPSKLESRWTFVAQGNMAAYAAAKLNAAYPTNAPPSGLGSTNMLFQVPGLCIADFKVNSGGFSFGMAGDDLAQFPHPAFHVLFTTNLVSGNWRPVRREFVQPAPPGGTVSFALTHAEVFGGNNPFAAPAVQHAPGCVPTTNTVKSPIAPPAVTYTRVSCPCALPGVNPLGFFTLVSDVDSAGGGAPDWWLNLHGVNPASLWTPVPGAPWMNYLDLYLSGLNPIELPPPPAGGTLPVLFYFTSDYASWEMTVKGEGPLDWGTYRVAKNTIGYSSSRTLDLHKGNTYNISMRWADSLNTGDYWYCWEATVDGQPGANTYNDYNPARRSGIATHFSGNGYVVNNTGGLLTSHVHMRDGGGGNVAGKLTAMLYVLADTEGEPFEIGFRKADGTPTDTVVVSKWENAFKLVGNVVEFKTPDFVDADPDRFYIYVKDRRRTEDVITGSYYDDIPWPNQWQWMPLFRQPDGTYLSTNHIIIADSADANSADLGALGADGMIRHQMTKRTLGGFVGATYNHDGVSLMATATVGEDVKTLRVEVALMMKDSAGNASVDYWRVYNDMTALKERFAQANINVVWNEKDDLVTMPFAPPPSVATNMTNWVAAIYGASGLEMAQAAREVVTASGLGQDNLRVIYVPELIRLEVPGTNTVTETAAGYAFAANSFKSNLDSTYVDTCFVSAKAPGIYVPAHEVLHLLGEEHVADKWNLMNKEVSPDGNYLDGTKRLTQVQVDRIRLDPRKKLK